MIGTRLTAAPRRHRPARSPPRAARTALAERRARSGRPSAAPPAGHQAAWTPRRSVAGTSGRRYQRRRSANRSLEGVNRRGTPGRGRGRLGGAARRAATSSRKLSSRSRRGGHAASRGAPAQSSRTSMRSRGVRQTCKNRATRQIDAHALLCTRHEKDGQDLVTQLADTRQFPVATIRTPFNRCRSAHEGAGADRRSARLFTFRLLMT